MPSHRPSPVHLIAFAGALCAPLAQAADAPRELPLMQVGERPGEASLFPVEPEAAPGAGPDAAGLLRSAPGAGVNYNGPLTGIVQYRGMFGARMDIQVDGARVVPSGPNWMDPPLHYAPMPLLESLELVRGIAPVSAGNEVIGGQVRARLLASRFGAGARLEQQAVIRAGGRSADEGGSLGVMAGLGNRHHRVHVIGSLEQGDDTRFGDGTIHPTGYGRGTFGMGYGYRSGDHEFGLDLRRNETGDTGTPALPMDIAWVDTDVYHLEYKGRVGEARLSAGIYGDDGAHKMTNYHLRQPPSSPDKYRYTIAGSDTRGLVLRYDHALGSGNLGLGLDAEQVRHDADVYNPNDPGFYTRTYDRISRDPVGVFAEWRGPAAAGWDLRAGARLKRIRTDAGTVDSSMAMMMPAVATLRDRFNASERARTDHDADLFLSLGRAVADGLDLTLTAASKTRSPSYQERYLWLPMQSTAGLADGNNYVGDVELRPERANEVELALDWVAGGLRVEPRVFWRRVKDYIQGVPATDPAVIMASSMMGDPTPLQFANVEARFYGADLYWRAGPADGWSLTGVASWVRGKRGDVDDDLYRIAPLNGYVALTRSGGDWSATLQLAAAARQDHVSVTNGEDPTPGYGIVNLGATWEPVDDLRLNLGITNLADRTFADHLNGINRVQDSDVAPGERLPGPGRSLYARLEWRW